MIKDKINGYKNLIEVICSIISVVLIGVFGLIISNQANLIAQKQTNISMVQIQPSIEMVIDNVFYDEESRQELIDVNILNNGYPAKYVTYEIIPYIDVLCNENYLGTRPINIYLYNIYYNISKISNQTGKLAQIELLSCTDKTFTQFYEEFLKIPKEYTKLYWDIELRYLIRVEYKDQMNNIDKIDFIINNNKEIYTKIKYGDEIFNEYSAMTEDASGMGSTSVETFFELNQSNIESVFKYALQKIRKLPERQWIEKPIYGDYEP